MKQHHTKALLSSVALVAIPLVWWLWPEAPPVIVPAGEPAAAPSLDRGQLPPVPSVHHRAGPVAAQTDRWSGRYNAHFKTRAEGPGPDRTVQKGELSLAARLDIAAAPSLGEGWFRASLSEPELQATASMYAPYGLDPREPRQGLETSFAFRLDERGALVERRFDREMPTAARMLAAVVASGFQIASAPQVGATSWTVRELGMAEPVEVSYRWVSDDSVVKQWRVSAPDARSSDGGGSTGQATVRHDSQGRLLGGDWAMTAQTDLAALFVQVQQGGAAPSAIQPSAVFTSATELTLERTHVEVAGRGPDDPTPSLATMVTELESGRPADPNGARPQPFADVSVDEIVAAIAQADVAEDFRRRRNLQQVLVVKARQDDALVERFEQNLYSATDRGVIRNLVEVLATAQTPRARRAMATLLTREGTPAPVQRDVARVNTLTEEPGDEVIDGLRAVAFDDSHAARTDALWALAAQANQLRDERPELSKELDEAIVSRATAVLDALSNEPEGPQGLLSDEQRAEYHVWMSSLGNLGGAHLFDIISPWLAHPNDYVRGTAYESLRFVEVEQVPGLLANAIAEDAHAHVRRMAVDTTNHFPPQATEAAVFKALADPEEDRLVRLSAAQQVARWSHERPALIQHVRQAAALEQDPDVRQLLAGFLPEHDVTNPGRSRGASADPASPPTTSAPGHQQSGQGVIQ